MFSLCIFALISADQCVLPRRVFSEKLTARSNLKWHNAPAKTFTSGAFLQIRKNKIEQRSRKNIKSLIITKLSKCFKNISRTRSTFSACSFFTHSFQSLIKKALCFDYNSATNNFFCERKKKEHWYYQ